MLARDGAGTGGKDVIKVVDFGLSRMLSARGQHTAPGIIVGTIEYMSPEATTGKREEIDARTDQWALAVVVYRLLSGRLPFQSSDAVRLMLQIRRDQPPPLLTLVPGLPPFVSAAVERALRKDKGERFESVQDFVRALQGLPLRLAAGDSRSESSSRALAAVPQGLPVEPSAPYAEYSAAQRRSEPSLGNAVASPERRSPVPPPLPSRSLAARRSERPIEAAAISPGAGAVAVSGALSMPRRLPPQIWLALLSLVLTAMTLLGLVLGQSRGVHRPLAASGGQVDSLRYLAPLLGSR